MQNGSNEINAGGWRRGGTHQEVNQRQRCGPLAQCEQNGSNQIGPDDEEENDGGGGFPIPLSSESGGGGSGEASGSTEGSVIDSVTETITSP